MSDLFDEAAISKQDDVSTTVRALGGDLLDEIAITSKKPEGLSDAMKEQALTEGRAEMVRQLNDDMSLGETFLVGVGRGLSTIGRAAGIVEPEAQETTTAFNALSEGAPGKQSIILPGGGSFSLPIDPKAAAAGGGEVTGETLPFLPLGVASGALKAGVTRVLTSMGLGALEGGAIVRGKGGDAAETIMGASVGGLAGGVFDVVLPRVGRAISEAFDRLKRRPTGPLLTPDGGPTPELVSALDETGTTFEGVVSDAVARTKDLTNTGFARVNQPGVDPEQAVRAARFEAQGIPATKGDITQDFGQQSAEQRLAVTTQGAPSDAMRQMRLEQSEAFKARASAMVDDLGVPAQTGDSLKAALAGRKATLRAEKNALYKQVAEANPEVLDIPLMTDDIVMALPDRNKLRRLARLSPQQMGALDDLLVEFGLDDTPELIEAFTGDITPLSLGNFEDFRAALNQIERSDISGTASVAIRPIREALDGEALLIDEAIQGSGLSDDGILATLKSARERVRLLKTEFSDQIITGRLINTKRDGVTPVIEASKAANELLRPTAPIENLQRTLSSLYKSGDKGKAAIKDMQASVVLGALDAALKAPSRKTAGVQTVGGYQFAKYLDNITDEKLELLFRGNPKGLSRLKNLKQTALDFSASSDATPKGSASVNMDIASGLTGLLGTFTGVPGLSTIMRRIAKRGDIKAAREALDASPEVTRTLTLLETQFPALVASFGVATAVSPIEDE